MLSFNGDVALKQNIITGIRTKAEQTELWQGNILVWNGTSGSLVSNILQSDDLTQWENFGLPKWLALTLDYFYVTAPTLHDGVEIGIQLLQVIPEGYDIQKFGSQYIIDLLTDHEDGLKKLVTSTDTFNAIETIVNVHQRCVQGDTVEAAEWRKLRKDLTEQTNQFAEESLDYRICSCVEAAAWNPVNSRTVIADTIRAWISAQSQFVIAQNWTEQDDANIRRLLKQLHDQAKSEQDNDDFINVFDLLDQKYPEEALRLKQYNILQSKQPEIFRKKSLHLLKQLFVQIA